MGICCGCCNPVFSTLEKKSTHKIETEMARNLKSAQYRILLLGSGNSGKTTIIKQMQRIHTANLPDSQIELYKNHIQEQMVSNMQTLCIKAQELNIAISPQNEACFKQILAWETPAKATSEHHQLMAQMWSDSGIKKTLKFRHKFQIDDNMEYFFGERLHDIQAPSYEPTFEDYIRSRVMTQGWNSVAMKCDLGGDMYDFEFIDVGGQRLQRKKWMGMLQDGIHAVVYVVAISEFDMMCYEDNSELRLLDSLALFETVIEKGFMDGKTCILFFNKWDLFEEKLADLDIPSIDKYFSDFPKKYNPRSTKDVAHYIFKRFHHIFQAKYPTHATQLHRHHTCSIDTKQIHAVMSAIQKDIIKRVTHNFNVL